MRINLKQRFINRLRVYLNRILYEDPIQRWRRLGAQIGEDVFIGPHVFIDEGFASLLAVENGAVISAQTAILMHDSAYNNLVGLPIKIGKVLIKKKAYIGVGSIILCGVTVGEQSLVGAGSLVATDIPDRSVAYGVPAVVKGRLEDYIIRYEEALSNPGRYQYWDAPAWRERRKSSQPELFDEGLREVLARFDARDNYNNIK